MANSNETSQIAEALSIYLAQNPESSAKQISSDLEIDKTIVNSTLYSNSARFTAIGERPPLWSLKESESQMDPALIANFEKLLTQIYLEHPPVLEDVDEIPGGNRRSASTKSTRHRVGKSHNADQLEKVRESKAVVQNTTREDESELKNEIEHLVRTFPGIKLDEISSMLGVSEFEVEQNAKNVKYLILGESPDSPEYSDSELALLDDLAKAATYAFPLSTNEFDDLVRRGFVKSVSAMRITQIFGSWRGACELAGVEAPQPLHVNYERRWTETELAETVARFLLEPEYRGAHHRYEEWREANMKVDEIPSSGTLKNYLGRGWPEVRNRGLQILRNRWLDAVEEIDD